MSSNCLYNLGTPHMAHNKYHGSGCLYTEMELDERAYEFEPRMLMPGYHGRKETGKDGKLILEPRVTPYNVGRNAAKRAKRVSV